MMGCLLAQVLLERSVEPSGDKTCIRLLGGQYVNGSCQEAVDQASAAGADVKVPTHSQWQQQAAYC
jgi:hypothetical protein